LEGAPFVARPVRCTVPRGVTVGLQVLGQVGAGSFAPVSWALPALNVKSGLHGAGPAHCAATSGSTIFGPLAAAHGMAATSSATTVRRCRIADLLDPSGHDAERRAVPGGPLEVAWVSVDAVAERPERHAHACCRGQRGARRLAAGVTAPVGMADRKVLSLAACVKPMNAEV